MQKQLFEIEVQAHTNRKEVDGVRASVKRILKAHDLAMNTQGDNVNVRIVAARVQDQVTAVSNVLKSHETVLSQVHSTLEESASVGSRATRYFEFLGSYERPRKSRFTRYFEKLEQAYGS